jgi:hypothetical protein
MTADLPYEKGVPKDRSANADEIGTCGVSVVQSAKPVRDRVEEVGIEGGNIVWWNIPSVEVDRHSLTITKSGMFSHMKSFRLEIHLSV